MPDDIRGLQLEVLRLRDELIGALAREGEARARLDGLFNSEARHLEHLSVKNQANLLAQKNDLEDQIDTILHSRTWRIGALLLKPAKPIRWLIRKRA